MAQTSLTVRAGFTLIELLVVIAIIGILSAVVLASLSNARKRGNDSAVQVDLHSVQTQAEVYFLTTGNNTYNPVVTTMGDCTTGFFASDASIAKQIAAAEVANGPTASGVVCNSSSSQYVVQSTLQNGINGKTYWCVDSTGVQRAEAAALVTTPTPALACL